MSVLLTGFLSKSTIGIVKLTTYKVDKVRVNIISSTKYFSPCDNYNMHRKFQEIHGKIYTLIQTKIW